MISIYITKEDEVYNITLTPEAARNPQNSVFIHEEVLNIVP